MRAGISSGCEINYGVMSCSTANSLQVTVVARLIRKCFYSFYKQKLCQNSPKLLWIFVELPIIIYICEIKGDYRAYRPYGAYNRAGFMGRIGLIGPISESGFIGRIGLIGPIIEPGFIGSIEESDIFQ